jgi:RNA polymerase sigma-70 factor (ECF subfamily)
MDPDPRTDEDLVAACNAGDVAAFEALYRRYRDWVVRLAHRFTGDHAEALDVMQETFAYLLGRFPGFRLTARLTSFLYPVVKHNALAARRKGRRLRLHTDSSAPAPEGASPGDPSPRHELANLQEALLALPDAQRETILMRFVDDMSLQEIALALNIPVGTVKSRIHNALATLRGNERTKRYFENDE